MSEDHLRLLHRPLYVFIPTQIIFTQSEERNSAFAGSRSNLHLLPLRAFIIWAGHFPPSRHSHSFPEDHDHWDTDSHYIKNYNPEAIARVKGVRKPNLLGQVIPVYGFGIFLYIIYLFVKLTSKEKPHRQGCRIPVLQSECTFEEMPTCQLVQLQARMSEKVKEKRISKVVHPSTRSRRGTRRREERKLKQLKEITQMMKERQLREGATPEEEAEEAPYTADWEGYPDETYPEYGMPSRRRRFPSVILEEPDQAIPTAEELAERMEKEEEDELADDACINEEVKMENNGENEEDDKDEQEYEDDEYDEEEEEEEEEDEDDVGEDQPCLPKGIDEDEDTLECLSEGEEIQKPSRRRQITFSDHRHVFHYPKGGAVGCKYEEEEEEEHEKEEEEEGNEEDENADEDSEEEEEEEIGDEEEEDQHNEERQGDTEEKEEEDPLMEAESLGFNDDVECDPEEQEVDLLDFLQSYQPEETLISNKSESPKAQTSGTLRMRHKKQKVKK